MSKSMIGLDRDITKAVKLHTQSEHVVCVSCMSINTEHMNVNNTEHMNDKTNMHVTHTFMRFAKSAASSSCSMFECLLQALRNNECDGVCMTG